MAGASWDPAEVLAVPGAAAAAAAGCSPAALLDEMRSAAEMAAQWIAASKQVMPLKHSSWAAARKTATTVNKRTPGLVISVYLCEISSYLSPGSCTGR